MGETLPTLEDVFMEVVGRSLSDEDVEEEDDLGDEVDEKKENSA
jgi:CBS domain containing-hemolysin-like protein